MKRTILYLLLCCILCVQAKAQTRHYNSVKSIVPRTGYTLQSSLNSGNSRITSRYFDDLGRPYQTVRVAAGPARQDIVTWQEYDACGRQSLSWLPVPFATGTGAPLTHATFRERSAAFYGDGRAYDKPVYETSPRDRVLELYGPGEAWQDNHKRVKTEYLSNQATGELACRRYHVADNGNRFEVSLQAGMEYYPAKSLSVVRTTDEDSLGISLEFKNKSGLTMLVRQKDGTGWHDTYYLYDSRCDLVAVLPRWQQMAWPLRVSGRRRRTAATCSPVTLTSTGTTSPDVAAGRSCPARAGSPASTTVGTG